MKKIAIDQVEMTAKEIGIEDGKSLELVDSLRKIIEEEMALKAGNDKEKKQFIIIANVDGLPAEIAERISEIPMTLVQIPVEADHTQLLGQIYDSTYEFNASIQKKGKTKFTPVLKVFESLSVVTRRFFKEKKILVKTKEPVIVITTDNKIPADSEAII